MAGAELQSHGNTGRPVGGFELLTRGGGIEAVFPPSISGRLPLPAESGCPDSRALQSHRLKPTGRLRKIGRKIGVRPWQEDWGQTEFQVNLKLGLTSRSPIWCPARRRPHLRSESRPRSYPQGYRLEELGPPFEASGSEGRTGSTST